MDFCECIFLPQCCFDCFSWIAFKEAHADALNCLCFCFLWLLFDYLKLKFFSIRKGVLKSVTANFRVFITFENIGGKSQFSVHLDKWKTNCTSRCLASCGVQSKCPLHTLLACLCLSIESFQHENHWSWFTKLDGRCVHFMNGFYSSIYHIEPALWAFKGAKKLACTLRWLVYKREVT